MNGERIGHEHAMICTSKCAYLSLWVLNRGVLNMYIYVLICINMYIRICIMTCVCLNLVPVPFYVDSK